MEEWAVGMNDAVTDVIMCNKNKAPEPAGGNAAANDGETINQHRPPVMLEPFFRHWLPRLVCWRDPNARSRWWKWTTNQQEQAELEVPKATTEGIDLVAAESSEAEKEDEPMET